MMNMHPDEIAHLGETIDLSDELKKLMAVAALRFVTSSEFHSGMTQVYSDIFDNLGSALSAMVGPREAGNHRLAALRAAAVIVAGY